MVEFVVEIDTGVVDQDIEDGSLRLDLLPEFGA